MQIYFNGYSEEHVKKGKADYHKMSVSYSYQGQSKTQTIVSFSNPAVYAAIKTFNQGDSLEVEIGEVGGYKVWTSIKKSEGTGGTVMEGNSTKSSTQPPARSNYETADERAKKQVYIIKQSAIAQAVATCIGQDNFAKEGFGVDDVLATAQRYVDWVLDDGSESQSQD